MDNDKQTKNLTLIGIQLMLATLLVVGGTIYLKYHPVSTIFKAGTHDVEVLLKPSEAITEPGKSITLSTFIYQNESSNDTKPGVISITIKYDNTHIKYTGFDNSRLSDKYDSVADPQTTDNTVQLSYALKDPTQLPDTNTVELTTLKFDVLKAAKSSISIDSTNSQIVLNNDNADEATIILQSATVNSLPVPTATPEVAQPSIAPTVNPAIESTKAVVPTVEPTKAPEATNAPTVQGTVPEAQPTQ